MEYIDVKNLSKAFGANHVLRNFSFTISKGESRILLGGSGTGKSVTLKCILNLIQPDSGIITLDGQPFKESTLHIGMLFQGAALFDSLSILENLMFPMREGRRKGNRLSLKNIQKLAYEMLDKVELNKTVANSYPSDLSGGMKKRAGLARALMTDPDILFFDEPTTGLDPIMSNVINDLIRSTLKDNNITGLTITHDINSAILIGDSVTMLYKGENIWDGDVQHLKKSGNAIVEQFVYGKTKGPYEINQ